MSDVVDMGEFRARRERDRQASSRAAHPSRIEDYVDRERLAYGGLDPREVEAIARRVDEMLSDLGMVERYGVWTKPTPTEVDVATFDRLRAADPTIIDEMHLWTVDNSAWRELAAGVSDAAKRIEWTSPDPERQAEVERAINLIAEFAGE